MPKLIEMPVDFGEFAAQATSRGYEPKDQRKDKTPANIFALKTKNGVKVEIKATRSRTSYVAGYGLNAEKLQVLKDELEDRGMVIGKANPTFLCINFLDEILSGFWTLVGLIEDIDGIAQQRVYARLGIEFKPDEAYMFIAETLHNAIKRGQPWAVPRGYGGFDALDKFCVVGYSVKGREQERNGKNAYREHMVPCDMMNRQGIKMFNEGATVEEIAAMFQTNNKILLISDDEQDLIDNKMGLKCEMPNGWNFGDDVFARIKAANIVLEQGVDNL
jgi:hypothetical protein